MPSTTPWLTAPLWLWAVCGLLFLGSLLAGQPIPESLATGLALALNVHQWLLIATVARRAAPRSGLRRAWGLLCIASLAGITGDSLWFITTATGPTPPYIPLADGLFLFEYATWCAAILRMPTLGGGSRTGLALDLLTVFTAALTTLWDTILRPSISANAHDTAAVVFAAGPILGDILMLTGLAVLFVRRPVPETAPAVAMFSVATFVYAGTDIVYAFEAANGTYVGGGWDDFGWFAGRFILSVAALRQLAPPRTDATLVRTSRLLERSGLILPIAATAVALVMVFRALTRGTTEAGTLGTAIGAGTLCLLIVARQVHAAVVNARLLAEVRHERDRSDGLLLNILPPPIAERLKQRRASQPLADSHPNVTVLFGDLVGFTVMSSRIPAEELVTLLDEVFTAFDALADKHGLEKIKTIGDCYMAVAGVPEACGDHAARAARMALDMRAALAGIRARRNIDLALRIGLHSGPLVAGVIGQRKFAYDLWGDTVNTASRMESHGKPGTIHVSAATREALGEAFDCETRGLVEIKGKGPLETYFLVGDRASKGP